MIELLQDVRNVFCSLKYIEEALKYFTNSFLTCCMITDQYR